MGKSRPIVAKGKAKAAADFEKIINEGRERKQNEALANQIFSRNRRQSAPVSTQPGAGPSLASRVGVKKRVASTTLGGRASLPASATAPATPAPNGAPRAPRGSLAARLSAPGQPGQQPARPVRATRQRTNQLAHAIERADSSSFNISAAPTGPRAQQQQQPRRELISIMGQAKSADKEVSIRGIAGPFSVLAQNFAPGTSAADVENAFTRVGGQILKCVVLKSEPFVLVEAVFASREGGALAINKFDGVMADGYTLSVFPNPAGTQPLSKYVAGNSSSNSSGSRRAPIQVVDGTRGFAEGDSDPVGRATSNADGNGRLYSDSMTAPAQKGRGFRGDWTRRP